MSTEKKDVELLRITKTEYRLTYCAEFKGSLGYGLVRWSSNYSQSLVTTARLQAADKINPTGDAKL